MSLPARTDRELNHTNEGSFQFVTIVIFLAPESPFRGQTIVNAATGGSAGFQINKSI